MPPWQAALLGLVEGLTEFLPVSSTGHLILLDHWLGQQGEGAHAFEIVIQAGALLAVVVHYRARLLGLARGLLAGEPGARRLALALVVGFVPAAVVGLALGKTIKRALFGPLPVAAAQIGGGLLMLAMPRLLRARARVEGLEHVSLRRALAIGVGQCGALWPGMSRSMCTILAAEASGLTTATAAEFSFLLALPTLGAATAYETLKSWRELVTSVPPASLATGLLTSFVVAWVVIAAFVRSLGRIGLAPFGVYRIALGLLVLVVVMGGR